MEYRNNNQSTMTMTMAMTTMMTMVTTARRIHNKRTTDGRRLPELIHPDHGDNENITMMTMV